ncbi:aquaporin [Microbacterium sp. 22215]|uniref:aquaporin n=1 Tax=Microbacterium sp. 22215 TaxID=3453893 RepID=UPI003F82DE5D
MSHALTSPTLVLRLIAEFMGTFLLVVGVVGAATFSAGFKQGASGLDIGFLGVAIALGLSVLIGASAWGPVSGGHFNPAVTIGLAIAGRFAWRDSAPYIAAQVLGGAAASSLIFLVSAGGPNGILRTAQTNGFASTGWGALSPGGFDLSSAFLVEMLATGVLVAVVLGVTTSGSNPALAPAAIGGTLTLVALTAIPISNGSFNPARSIATAIYGGEVALSQLWMSIVAPICGALIVGGAYSLERRWSNRRVQTS